MPDPDGPISELMPSSSIASANKDVESLLDGDKELFGTKRPQYIKYSDEERAKVAKRASEMGAVTRGVPGVQLMVGPFGA